MNLNNQYIVLYLNLSFYLIIDFKNFRILLLNKTLFFIKLSKISDTIVHKNNFLNTFKIILFKMS